MDGKENCTHCGGSGVCNNINEDASCSDCVEAAGIDMAYYKGHVPCAVCKGTGTVVESGGKGES
jgi:RecJ-like exonuclease